MVTRFVTDGLDETDPMRLFFEGFMMVRDVARELGITERVVGKHIADGKLRAICLDIDNRKVQWMIHRNDLEAFRAIREAKSAAKQRGERLDWAWVEKPSHLRLKLIGSRMGVKRAYGSLRGVSQARVEIRLEKDGYFCRVKGDPNWSRAIYIPEGGGIKGYEFEHDIEVAS